MSYQELCRLLAASGSGTFGLSERRLGLPTSVGSLPLVVRLGRAVSYSDDAVRSVTLVFDQGWLWVEVTAELPVATYRAGREPERGRVAGVDLGIIHPYAVAVGDGQMLLVSGRAIRAEHCQHLADTKGRRRATAARAPKRGQRVGGTTCGCGSGNSAGRSRS